jgi:hypothetical protein
MTNPTSTPENASKNFHDLADAVQHYLDMLYDCNADMADGIFHADARLSTLDGDKVIFRTVEEYKELLRNRKSPRSQGAAREDELLTLDMATPRQALVKVKMRINDLVFIDYLTMLKLDAGWRIVSKIYYRL